MYELVCDFLNFNLVNDLVHAWCMIGIQKWQKITMTENVWSKFSNSGVCAVCEKTGIWPYHLFVQYQRLQEMTLTVIYDV